MYRMNHQPIPLMPFYIAIFWKASDSELLIYVLMYLHNLSVAFDRMTDVLECGKGSLFIWQPILPCLLTYYGVCLWSGLDAVHARSSFLLLFNYFIFNNYFLFFIITLFYSFSFFLFFSILFWDVWMTGSWCSSRASDLCLWRGRAQFRTLVHQKPPSST